MSNPDIPVSDLDDFRLYSFLYKNLFHFLQCQGRVSVHPGASVDMQGSLFGLRGFRRHDTGLLQ